jgi:hypothetical protein
MWQTVRRGILTIIIIHHQAKNVYSMSYIRYVKNFTYIQCVKNIFDMSKTYIRYVKNIYSICQKHIFDMIKTYSRVKNIYSISKTYSICQKHIFDMSKTYIRYVKNIYSILCQRHIMWYSIWCQNIYSIWCQKHILHVVYRSFGILEIIIKMIFTKREREYFWTTLYTLPIPKMTSSSQTRWLQLNSTENKLFRHIYLVVLEVQTRS